ncbi:MAG: DNA repair protein RadA [Christensenellales bacterium]|jgi:DNA repair protein RadA/Sms
MAKPRTSFVCASCGYESAKWMGRCGSCGEWNTMAEEVTERKARPALSKAASAAVAIKDIGREELTRCASGIGELDRVLGGGVVPGSAVLIGGDPGIGKSTLLLQMCNSLCATGKTCLYISGEESGAQIQMRAKRLGVQPDSLYVLSETDMDAVEAEVAASNADFAVIDSVQTMYRDAISSSPGSVSQVREAASVLARLAKAKGMAVFLVGHVTKEGSIAGPKMLEHMVDTVLYFEGERGSGLRILRAVKNRFGSTNEIGVFDMTSSGMKEVGEPSRVFMEGRSAAPGSAVVCCMEGTRPVMVEIQALVTPTSFGNPRRMATGVEYNRMVLMLAVMEKRLGFALYSQDVYINVAGGLKLSETGVDLGIIAAVASAYKNIALPRDMAVMGEVGLTGELRHAGQIERRLAECAKMGFDKVIVPKLGTGGVIKPEGLKVYKAEDVEQALSLMF